MSAFYLPVIKNLESFRKQLLAILEVMNPSGGAFYATASTTNGSATTIKTVEVPTNNTLLLNAAICARRTGGSSGAAGDGAGYTLSAVAKNVAGTVTIIAQSLTFTGESQAGWNAACAVAGTTIAIQVTGAANNNVNWVVHGQALEAA